MPLADQLGECCQCGLLTRLACVCARACVRVLVRVSVFVLRLQAWNADSYGAVHDFDKPTEKATEKAPEENVGEGDAYQIEALKLHLKVSCQLSLWMES
jgi:hypothetical protein